MNLDIAAYEGRPGLFRRGPGPLPACIFIHGIGMDKSIWVEPEKGRVMGGLYPLTVMLKGFEPPFRTLYHDLRDAGYTVVAWSQRRPVGPMEEAVGELDEVISSVRSMPHSGIVLIGHSRGGLIARSYILNKDDNSSEKGGIDTSDIKGLITLSTPHRGSEMARWAAYLAPFASFLESLLPEEHKGPLAVAVSRMAAFLQSEGVRELLPDSELIASMKAARLPAIYGLSAGGTDPVLIRVAGLSAPEVLARLITLPDEMTEGKGDGLVSLGSSVLPGGAEHLSFHLNHAGMLVDKAVRDAVMERIRGL